MINSENPVNEGSLDGPETPSSSGSRSPRACARVMSKSFVAKTGVEVTEGVFLGRELGAGVQAKVFDLVHADGTPNGKVLKLGHQDLSHNFLSSMASSMLNLQAEWELGMQLKAALEEPDGSLPGFVRTCDCMVIVHDEKKGQATFQGMIMERVNGWPISKRVADPSFHNIHFIREMLFQVFSALDRAQRALGFNHADLGLGNVMEHYPALFPDVQKGAQDANVEALETARNPAKKCVTCPTGASLLPGRSSAWRRTQVGKGCSAPPPIAGFSCDSDGNLEPLGPHIEFKIIDYGVGEFNETLAQAAGGHEPEETLRNIQEVFAQKGIPLGADSKRQIIDMVSNEGNVGSGSSRLQRWRFGQLKGNRFAAILDPSTKCRRKHKKLAAAKNAAKSAIQMATAPRGPIERMYRHFWERKGDVFHLLLALAVALDDRVWPKEDERDVNLFASLVHHVTGVKMRAYFASLEDPTHLKVMGKKNKKNKRCQATPESAQSTSQQASEAVYGARVRCFAAFRRTRMILGAHFKPFNSGLLAGEALVSPFFGMKGAPHAELPVCVEAAFPFRTADEQN